MSSPHPFISIVAATVILFAVVTIGSPTTVPSVSTTILQNLQEISEAVHKLKKEVADQRSCSSLKDFTEALQSQQTTMTQLLSKNVCTTPPLCQTVNATIGQVAYLENRLQKVESIASQDLEDKLQNQSQALGTAVGRMDYLEDKLQNQSQALEVAVNRVVYLEDKLQNQSHTLEAAADEVAYLKNRLQKVETDVCNCLEPPPNLEDKLRDEDKAVQVTVNKLDHLDERLQEVQTIALQPKGKNQDPLEEEGSDKGPCRSPFLQWGDDCLFVNQTLSMTWEDARKFCRALEGDLAVPSDILKLREFLNKFGEESFWLGGSDLSKEGEWRWLNGSEMDLSVGWASGEPNNGGGDQDCLQHWGKKKGFFDDIGCSNKKRFACQDIKYAQ